MPWFTFISALWLACVYNLPFWSRVIQARGVTSVSDAAFVLSVFVIVVLALNSFLTLLVFRGLARPVVIFLIFVSAVVAGFMVQFGIVVDKSMMQNVMETDWNEAHNLITIRLLAIVGCFGLLPAIITSRVRLRPRPALEELTGKLTVLLSSLAAIALLFFAFSAEYSSLLRTHRELRFMLTPVNAIHATATYLRQKYHRPAVFQQIGLDAHRKVKSATGQKPVVLVLVIGETARAGNFSLNGYDRPTNPLLSRHSVINFSRVNACGTSTAVSLPCMFSDLGEDAQGGSKAQNREGLLDVLARAGFDVIWWDNNSGCKGVCGRAEFRNLASSDAPDLCSGGECLDEILLQGLEQRVSKLKTDSVIVLHQKGSHGPAYFRRYPARFEAFTEACKSVDLSTCTPETIRNAYDNSILYTDFVLSRIIEILAQNTTSVDSQMLYLSDHGESLGEKGLYLHGIPKIIAPSVQFEVPMIAWFSEGFAHTRRLDLSCVRDEAGNQYSHDNLFHSVLGLLDVQTSVYNARLDIFAACRNNDTVSVNGPRRS